MIAERIVTTDADKWYAVCVKSRSEKLVATMAHHRGFQEFLPVYECRRRWSDRMKSVEMPLFPGYVFCRFNPDHRLPLVTIPGVLHIVGLGRVPIPCDDTEIAALQAASTSGLPAEPWPYLKAGDRLRLDRGPLAGVEGLLIEIRKSYRLVLSVTLLNRSVAVEIDPDWATPLAAPGRSIRPVHFKAFQAPSDVLAIDRASDLPA